jgi:hypothetical protein
MNAAAMTANRAIAQGGAYDTGTRHFLFDRREVPRDLDLKKDDWIVFDDKHYDIQSVEDYGFKTGWLVVAKELKGRLEVIDEIHDPQRLPLEAADRLALHDHPETAQ